MILGFTERSSSLVLKVYFLKVIAPSVECSSEVFLIREILLLKEVLDFDLLVSVSGSQSAD